jgi:hypothetical protein
MSNDRPDEHEFLSRLLDGERTFDDMHNDPPDEFQFVTSLNEVKLRS